MKLKTRLIVLILLITSCCVQTYAQIEVAHLNSKGFSATGFGAFLNITLPVSEYGAISTEAGFYYFKKNENNVALVPFLLGYRHMLQDSESGFYIEPNAGYNIGASDIQKNDEFDSPIPDGTGGWVELQVKGFTAGLGAGYIIPSSFPLNIGLRYQRIFVSNDPSLNLLSFRLSRPLSFKRREN